MNTPMEGQDCYCNFSLQVPPLSFTSQKTNSLPSSLGRALFGNRLNYSQSNGTEFLQPELTLFPLCTAVIEPPRAPGSPGTTETPAKTPATPAGTSPSPIQGLLATGKVIGDPHFTGFDGVAFDFQVKSEKALNAFPITVNFRAGTDKSPPCPALNSKSPKP